MVSEFIAAIRSAAFDDDRCTAYSLARYGLNGAWSCTQGLGTAKSLIKQGCDVCGRHIPGTMRLVRSGNILGPRLCAAHHIDGQMADPAWMSRGPCIVCKRPRGATRNEFAGQGLTSCCSYCRMRKSGAEKAGKVRDMEKYAKDHDGCKQCGAKEEFGKPKIRGLAKTDGASITS